MTPRGVPHRYESPAVRSLLVKWALRFASEPIDQKRLVEAVLSAAKVQRERSKDEAVEVALFRAMRDIVQANLVNGDQTNSKFPPIPLRR